MCTRNKPAPPAPKRKVPPPGSTPPPKKSRRKGNACDPCHVDHQPCTMDRPSCARCTKTNRVCTYDRPYRQRGPQKGYKQRESAALLGLALEKLPGLEDCLTDVIRREQESGRLEQRLRGVGGRYEESYQRSNLRQDWEQAVGGENAPTSRPREQENLPQATQTITQQIQQPQQEQRYRLTLPPPPYAPAPFIPSQTDHTIGQAPFQPWPLGSHEATWGWEGVAPAGGEGEEEEGEDDDMTGE